MTSTLSTARVESVSRCSRRKRASWARVEAGGHFPSDVLFAAGATNFLAGFVHDAFLGLGAQPGVVVSRGPDGEGWEVGLVWNE